MEKKFLKWHLAKLRMIDGGPYQIETNPLICAPNWLSKLKHKVPINICKIFFVRR